jgi:membrane associated rhomboid family serine protease
MNPAVWSPTIAELGRCVATLCVLVLIWAVYLADVLVYKGSLARRFCLRPASVVSGEVWRLFSSSLLHSKFTHLLMNSVSLFQIGRDLERRFGALKFLYLMALFDWVSGLLVCVISFALLRLLKYRELYHGSSIGLSGVLCALLAVQCSNADGRVSLYGIIDVPARLYPWIMVILMQLLPGTSFVGHVSGIIVGYAYTLGLFWAFAPRCPGRSGGGEAPPRNPQAGAGYQWQGRGRRIG